MTLRFLSQQPGSHSSYPACNLVLAGQPTCCIGWPHGQNSGKRTPGTVQGQCGLACRPETRFYPGVCDGAQNKPRNSALASKVKPFSLYGERKFSAAAQLPVWQKETPLLGKQRGFGIEAWQCPTFTWGDPTLSSALSVFTSEFGMGSGGTRSLWPPGNFVSSSTKSPTSVRKAM